MAIREMVPEGATVERIYAGMDKALAGSAEHVVIVSPGFALTFVVMAWTGMPIDALGHVNLRSSSGDAVAPVGAAGHTPGEQRDRLRR